MTTGAMLHELPDNQQRKQIGKVIRDDLVIKNYRHCEEQLQKSAARC